MTRLTTGVLLALAVFFPVAHLDAQAVPAARGTVTTDTLWAQSLGTSKALTVYLPPSYHTQPARRYPVLYYLHGLHGGERDWVDAGRIHLTLDSLVAAGAPEAIVIMPDGDDSWYTTWNQLPDMAGCRADSRRKEPASSYCVPWPHYDDYIAHDIVQFVDAHYRTRADRQHRGIAGLSMGGYGAVMLALAYPQVFAAAASHSGILSPRLLAGTPSAQPARYASTTAELEQAARGLWASQWPAFGRDTIGWAAREPRHFLQQGRTPNPMPAIRFDSGVDDALAIEHNRDLHQTLSGIGVSHEYVEWPGGHTWNYWRTHVAESLMFLLGVAASPQRQQND